MVGKQQMAGVVVSVGRMMKTVKVRMVKQQWSRYLRKNYATPYNVLVHDHNSSLLEGDVVTIAPERHSKLVKHSIDSIIVPFGKPLEDRPPILTMAERSRIFEEAKAQREVRRKERAKQGIEAGTLGQSKLVDDGGKGGGKGPDGQGREVLPGGKHKFKSINEEAGAGKKRALKRHNQATQHGAELEDVEAKDPEKMQKQRLGR